MNENNLNLKRSDDKTRKGILKRSLYHTASAKQEFDSLSQHLPGPEAFGIFVSRRLAVHALYE